MRKIQSEAKGGRVTSLLEWQTCDSDAEWQAPSQETFATLVFQPEVTPRPSWLALHWRVGAALLLILATIGFWTWSVAQRGVAQIEGDLSDRVESDLWTKATQDGRSLYKRSASALGDGSRPLTSTVQLLALPGEMAIVQVVTQSGSDQPVLSQTRFYQQTADGWMRTKPDDELWGSRRHLESSYFIFNFRQNDAQVVSAVAPQMDALYTKLLRNFGLAPNAEKLVINVSVEQITGVMLTPQWAHEPLVVPSPAVYLAPVKLSGSAILAQSIALPLIEYMEGRAIEDHAIPSRWRPLLTGIGLWQLWDSDMPLARWRNVVVTSLYPDGLGRKPIVSDRYTELCGMHSLWVPSPMMTGIPFECHISAPGNWVVIPWLANLPPTRLDGLNTPRKGNEQFYDEADYYFGPTETVTIATLLEYAVTTYGYEQLPMLLASLGQYDDWETLVPAVFGLSATDFEAGWRSYLAQQYNVSLDH